MTKAKEENQGRFNMNLQLFSDSQPSAEQLQAQAMAILQGGGQQPSQQAPAAEQPMTGEEGNPQNSPQTDSNSGQPVQDGQQPTQTPQSMEQPSQAPQNADALILGKFKSPDELANGYVNVERAFSQKSQELAAKDQQIQAMQQQMEQMKQQIGNVVNPQQQQPQPTPEEMNEQFMNQFYENPTQSIQQMVQQAIEKSIMPQIAPIQQQYQAQQQQQALNQAISEFSQNTPDFQAFKPVMNEILVNNPELNSHPGGPKAALNIAYQMAKGQQYKDPNSLLQDQNFVKQNILSNPDIKNQIIQEYLQGVKQGNQAPQVISGQANGVSPIVPENRPNNMDEAKAIALKMMQG